MGSPAPRGLEASITVTAPVALSFRFLGVGIWQGRVVELVFLIGAIIFLYLLSVKIYNHVVANISLAALFLMSIFPEWHPLIMGRQVLAEIPMLLLVLAGYWCFYITISDCLWFLPLTVLLLATGAVTKSQAFPFLTVSLIVPLVLAIYARQWRLAGILAWSLITFVLAVALIVWFQSVVVGRYSTGRIEFGGVGGIYSVVAFVPNLRIRWLAVEVSLFLMPTILGVLYVTRESLSEGRWRNIQLGRNILCMALLSFTGSWLVWYILCSNSHPRYVAPASFVGNIFVAKLLRDLLDRRVRVFSHRATRDEFLRLPNRGRDADALLALLLIGVWSFATAKMIHQTFIVERDESVQRVAEFLNTQTPVDSLIETYDSEVHFLLNRSYHFPPDQIHVDLIRRTFPGNYGKVNIKYDPLAANPDYLVVGDFIKGLRLYDPVIRSNAFRLIRSFNKYDIYERVR